MTKQRFGLSLLNLGLLGSVLGIAFGACTRQESDETSGTTTGNFAGGAGNVTNPTATGSATTTTTPVSTGKGGATPSASGGTGNVTACNGIPAVAADTAQVAASCDGVALESEPQPVDMIILMDRSISNSYAIGSETVTSAAPGQTRRWDVLTAAMEGLASDPRAALIGASITFFSITGGSNETLNCNAADYAKPVVPLGLLSQTGTQIVAAMQALTPSGLTPTVPALTGVLQYAMAEKQKDDVREKVVVMISDGFPTQCTLKSPSDVTNVIAEAAAAPVPIRTFIIGIGAPGQMDAAEFNLLNYARSGNTGKTPFVLDEAAGAAAVQEQLITTLLNISKASLACAYEISPPPGSVIDPDKVMFTWKPNVGDLQEIPRVTNAGTCAKSTSGGWYFDNPAAPSKITVCPCTCANFGAGKATVVYGCKPILFIQ